MDVIIAGFGGFFGALSRYGLGKLISSKWQGDFPLGTFLINILGSFLLGFLFVLLNNNRGMSSFAATGVLGAFTTYSTFSYETISLVINRKSKTAAAYLTASLACGLLAGYAGLLIADRV